MPRGSSGSVPGSTCDECRLRLAFDHMLLKRGLFLRLLMLMVPLLNPQDLHRLSQSHHAVSNRRDTHLMKQGIWLKETAYLHCGNVKSKNKPLVRRKLPRSSSPTITHHITASSGLVDTLARSSPSS